MQTETKNILDYSSLDIKSILENNPDTLVELFTQFSQRYVHIKQLGIQRNTYLNWEHGGLIPYERGEKGWRKFSFLESVWIKTILEMRALGMATENIKKIKGILWEESQDDFFKLIVDNLKSSPDTKEKRKVLKQIKEEGTRVIKAGFAQMQLSPLMFVVIVSLIRKITYLLVINKDEEVSLVPLASAADVDQTSLELQKELFTKSCTVINLWSIMVELSANKNVTLDYEVLVEFLSPLEKEVLDIVNNKGYAEILITKEEGGKPSHIKVTKKGPDEDTIRKLQSFLKKGVFQHIDFKTRDGKLIHYQQTDVIKLKK